MPAVPVVPVMYVPLRRLVVVLGLAMVGYLAFTTYETLWFDLPLVREGPVLSTPYYLVRSGFSIIVAALIVGTIAGAGDRGARASGVSLRPLERDAAWSSMVAALVFTGIFLASPAAFAALADEDTLLEWASAALLFLGSGLFIANALRRLRSATSKRLTRTAAVEIAVASCFALGLFVIGMEEISWMQRIIGFATPESLAQINWQGEFNFHNVQTDLSETLYYVCAGLFLGLLPLLWESGALRFAPAALSSFIPPRVVAAVSAPAAIFNYGHWNLIPIQIATLASIFALLAFAWNAAARKDRTESLLFAFLAFATSAGQATFLAYGDRMEAIPNATEFKEFFIALGLACFAFHALKHASAEASPSPVRA